MDEPSEGCLALCFLWGPIGTGGSLSMRDLRKGHQPNCEEIRCDISYGHLNFRYDR